MGWFHDEARRAAARQFGRRLYPWYVAAHAARTAAPWAAAAALLTAAGFGAAWLAERTGLPAALRIAALAVAAALLLWLGIETVTGAGVRRRAAGHRNPIPYLAITAVAALLGASFLIR
ncbi:hypothetical protein ABT297_11000 [Dactylosporangium sp. NPDC000555]|uniref:hypothetical protein n=1 Tax=Dactylosporangium sp. NPDC000555 TaxID=3154260 RepID=UPI003332E937